MRRRNGSDIGFDEVIAKKAYSSIAGQHGWTRMTKSGLLGGRI